MRVALAVVLVLLGGCSYYNGMYRVDRLAGQARSAEREGRTFTATSLWGQVSVKAESALVRHPRSGWADRARLLQGTALARLRDCRGALSPLQAVMTGPDPVLAEEATVLVGTCQLTLGDPGSAATAFARLTGSRDSVRRNQALFYHGRALRMGGEYAAALVELEQSSLPRSRGERAAALAGSFGGSALRHALFCPCRFSAPRNSSRPYAGQGRSHYRALFRIGAIQKKASEARKETPRVLSAPISLQG